MKREFRTMLTFLGTGTSQGVPMIGCNCEVCTSKDAKDNRLRSSVLIQHNGLSILIDAGPDFRQQLLRESITQLDAILLTHEHKDHTGGLDDVRALNYHSHKALPIFCEERVIESLHMEYSYAFSEFRYPGIPEFDIKTINNNPFYVESLYHQSDQCLVMPIRAKHYKLPILGFRIGNIAYITDANFIPNEELDKLKGLSVFVINTVRKEKHISHYSLSEAVELARRVDAKRSYLTHLSHQIGTHESLQKELPPGIFAAFDGLCVE